MAIDACNENIYRQIKGGNYESKINLLKQCAEKFPNRISTHLIVGLGETEEEIIKIIDSMHRVNISVGLFAFNPVRGTKLEKCTSPHISTYRRVQIANYLLKNKFIKFENLKFEKNKLVKINIDKQNVLEKLMDGKAFETPGCPGCNRPYYTEKPGGTMYNYPKKLTSQQLDMAIKESELQII
ncbi:hypothetical protein ACFIJ5_07225 [Haloimpatiens sp. FM7330]|uniref:hypothetical protein n=1 Tax=Haloimpatiens sp. FM7330 TaxID=3298610 RepID=UPI003639EE7D